MKKLPYESFVKAFIIHRDAPVDILVQLKEMRFSIPSNIADLCKSIFLDLKKLNPQHFENTKDPSDEFLIEAGVYGFYTMFYKLGYDHQMEEEVRGFEGAMRLAEDPKMRRAIQSMALANINDEDIELMLNARYDLNYKPEDILFFLKHFFNVKGWRVPELRELVETEQQEDFKAMYVIALQGDKDYLLWKLGLSPNRSYQEMLQDMMNDAFYLFKENAKPGKNSDVAQKWSALALKVAEKLERAEKDDQEATTLFQSIQFKLQAPSAPKSIVRIEDIGDDVPVFQQEIMEDDTTKLKDLESEEDSTSE